MKLLNRTLRVHSCLSDGERETEKESEGETETERERESDGGGRGEGWRLNKQYLTMMPLKHATKRRLSL